MDAPVSHNTDPQKLFTGAYLRRLIIPLILEQALLFTVGLADTMMVSSLGEVAVSGVSLIDMINALILSVLAALATGGAVVTSQCLGAGRFDRACESSNQLIYTTALAGIAIAAICFVLRRPILSVLFGHIEGSVMDAASLYFSISAISYPFIAVYDGCAALFRSMGNSKITLYASIVQNVVNVCGNALCIFGLGMGVEGAAIPSLVSRIVAMLILLVLLLNQNLTIHIVRGKVGFDFDCVSRILRIGIPSGIENGIFQLGRIAVVSIIALFGTTQIAANGVANSIDYVSIIAGFGMNLAVITVIGQCVGAGDEKLVKRYAKKLMGITYALSVTMQVVVFLALDALLALFGLSAETTELARILVIIHLSAAALFWPSSFTTPNILRACNDVKFPMAVSIFSMLAVRVGLGYVFAVFLNLGAIGIWISMSLDWVLRTIVFVTRLVRGTWRKHMYT